MRMIKRQVIAGGKGLVRLAALLRGEEVQGDKKNKVSFIVEMIFRRFTHWRDG